MLGGNHCNDEKARAAEAFLGGQAKNEWRSCAPRNFYFNDIHDVIKIGRENSSSRFTGILLLQQAYNDTERKMANK